MIILLTILLTVAVLFEGAVTTLPVTLVCLICFTVMKRDSSVFLPAFLAGLLIDVFRVQQIGSTSLYYLSFLLLILLYKKKYEIYSSPFVMLSTFFGSFFFLLIFALNEVLIQSIVASVLAVLLFAGLRFVADRKEHQQKTKFLPI